MTVKLNFYMVEELLLTSLQELTIETLEHIGYNRKAQKGIVAGSVGRLAVLFYEESVERTAGRSSLASLIY